MQFERSSGDRRPIGLTSLIDVVFILLFFFMLTTSFIRTESMELSFPSAAQAKEKAAAGTGIQIFLYDDERLFLGKQEMPLDQFRSELRVMLFKQPERSILLLSAKGVTVQRLVNVMDDIYLMGGQNVAVAAWNPAEGGPKVTPVEAEVSRAD